MQSRVLKGAFERLELHKAKVLRAVLRGRGGGNAALLPDHGAKYRPKVTENGYTERGNPPWLSQVKLEQVTNRKSRWSRMS